MKEKILKELRNEYAHLGLGEKAFSGVAAFLEKTGIKEEDIASRIKGEDVKLLLTSIQGESDSLRNTNARLTKENEELKSKTSKKDKKEKDDDDVGDDTETAKALKQIQDAESAMIAKVHDIMKSKGCTNDFIRKTTLAGITVADGDTAESLAEKYKEQYDANFKDAFGEGYIPPMGNRSSSEFKSGDFSAEKKRLQKEGLLPSDSK